MYLKQSMVKQKGNQDKKLFLTNTLNVFIHSFKQTKADEFLDLSEDF